MQATHLFWVGSTALTRHWAVDPVHWVLLPAVAGYALVRGGVANRRAAEQLPSTKHWTHWFMADVAPSLHWLFGRCNKASKGTARRCWSRCRRPAFLPNSPSWSNTGRTCSASDWRSLCGGPSPVAAKTGGAGDADFRGAVAGRAVGAGGAVGVGSTRRSDPGLCRSVWPDRRSRRRPCTRRRSCRFAHAAGTVARWVCTAHALFVDAGVGRCGVTPSSSCRSGRSRSPRPRTSRRFAARRVGGAMVRAVVVDIVAVFVFAVAKLLAGPVAPVQVRYLRASSKAGTTA